MNSKIINAFMFAAGAAIGSVVTWKVLKVRYERFVQEEVDNFKEDYAKCMSNLKDTNLPDVGEDEEAEEEEDPELAAWEELDDEDDDDSEEEEDQNDYNRLVNTYTSMKGGAAAMDNAPRVISPYEFGELDDYHTIELTYYADDILEDEEYNIVNDRDDLIGPSALDTFGEYEDDSVFVRNDRLQTDFQILKDYRTYSEARSVGPKRVDDE